jgi:FkbM family methyltransferase
MEYIPHNWDEHNRWNTENGDKTHRLNYDLNKESIVFDLGGYKGEWSEIISDKFNCYIHIFEPVKEFYDIIFEKFKNNSKVKVYHFGLGDLNGSSIISLNGDSSSYILEGKGNVESIEIISINKFMRENNITNINLMKVNIESAEYSLLESLIKENNLDKFENIQVQFHTFIPDCVERRDNIRNHLSKTHKLTYDFTFIWENWEKL